MVVEDGFIFDCSQLFIVNLFFFCPLRHGAKLQRVPGSRKVQGEILLM